MNKIAKTIKKPTKALLKKWYRMTDENYHSEVLVDIADWYAKATGDKDFIKPLQEVLAQHLKDGCMTEDNIEKRRFWSTMMFDRIRNRDPKCMDLINGSL